MITPDGISYAVKTDLDEAPRLVKVFQDGGGGDSALPRKSKWRAGS